MRWWRERADMGRGTEKRLTQSLQVVRARVEVVGRVHALCKVCLDQYHATGTCTKQQKSVDKRGVDRVKHRQGGILPPKAMVLRLSPVSSLPHAAIWPDLNGR